MEKEYNRSPQEVLEELGSCPTGLTEAEAAERLAKHGPNKLKEAEKPSLLQRFLTQLKDPMLLILMAAAAVSAVTNALSGESFTEVFIILVVVLLNAVLGVVQESKAEAAIEALQTMTAAKCKVLRDGHQVVIESSQLVPGDVVLLEAGDAVPADGRRLESASRKIEEAALTGGDDYELVFTAPPSAALRIEQAGLLTKTRLTRIGKICEKVSGDNLTVRSQNGGIVTTPTQGFDHFAA